MSRILLIEPYRLLQHAFTAALFAEHELAIAEAVPDTVRGADLVILDAAALRERGLLSGMEPGMIQRWQVPVVWLDADDQAEVPGAGTIIRAKLPVDKAALKQALLAARAASVEPIAPTRPTLLRRDERVSKSPKAKQPEMSSVAGESKENIIELVDVVEEVASVDGSEMNSVK
jgi:hypothetical protein